jgi:threonine/homoserine/homoserine lactone efflux protein
LGSIWPTVYALALDAVGAFVGRPSVRTVIETVTGGALVLLGVRLAFQRR